MQISKIYFDGTPIEVLNKIELKEDFIPHISPFESLEADYVIPAGVTVSNIVNGKSQNPNIDLFSKISFYMGSRIDLYIRTDEGDFWAFEDIFLVKKLKTIAEHLQISQKEISDKSGISEERISEYFNSTVMPNWEKFEKMRIAVGAQYAGL